MYINASEIYVKKLAYTNYGKHFKRFIGGGQKTKSSLWDSNPRTSLLQNPDARQYAT